MFHDRAIELGLTIIKDSNSSRIEVAVLIGIDLKGLSYLAVITRDFNHATNLSL